MDFLQILALFLCAWLLGAISGVRLGGRFGRRDSLMALINNKKKWTARSTISTSPGSPQIVNKFSYSLQQFEIVLLLFSCEPLGQASCTHGLHWCMPWTQRMPMCTTRRIGNDSCSGGRLAGALCISATFAAWFSTWFSAKVRHRRCLHQKSRPALWSHRRWQHRHTALSLASY